ncbi:MAG TPA: hypothetical protein EYQ75_00330 [Planctomycetaceae bacterium]|nr:hypothetical protein [Planctomycetaceae bacterium]
MSLIGDMKTASTTDDLVWRALSDPARRRMLDLWTDGAKTTGQIVEQANGLCRTAGMKHLEVLVAADLVVVRREQSLQRLTVRR